MRNELETGEGMIATQRTRVLLVVDGVIQWVYGWAIAFDGHTQRFLVCWDDLAYGLGLYSWCFPEQLCSSDAISEMPA